MCLSNSILIDNNHFYMQQLAKKSWHAFEMYEPQDVAYNTAEDGPPVATHSI